jgi:hypothetical protein
MFVIAPQTASSDDATIALSLTVPSYNAVYEHVLQRCSDCLSVMPPTALSESAGIS